VRRATYWIPGVAVDASIIGVEKDGQSTMGVHLLNPYLYTIGLQHGRYKWRVVKRYQDFATLNQRLLGHRAMEAIKKPMRRAKNRLEDVVEDMMETGTGAGESEWDILLYHTQIYKTM